MTDEIIEVVIYGDSDRLKQLAAAMNRKVLDMDDNYGEASEFIPLEEGGELQLRFSSDIDEGAEVDDPGEICAVVEKR